MKQKIQLILASFLLVSGCFLLYACDHDDWEADNNTLTDASHGSLTNHHVVATGEARNVTKNSATILCSFNYNYKGSLNIKPYIIYSDKYDTSSGSTFSLNGYDKYASRVQISNFTSSSCEVTLTNLKPSTTYYYCAYATANKSGYYEDYAGGEVKSFTTSFDSSIIEAVDLGLSVKWANINIGATHPEEVGGKFYWGGTEAVDNEYQADWHDFSLTKMKNQGYIDNNNNLCSAHDAATQIWSSRWRMPTKDEFQELIKKCSWKRTTKNGNNVFLITGPNNNVIYLPYTYSTCYWTSTCNTTSSYYLETYYSSFNPEIYYAPRSDIMFIRPVQK